jgi:hypothetical protein
LVSYYLTKDYNLECVVIDPRGTSFPKKILKQISIFNLQIKEIRKEFNTDFDQSLIEKSCLIIGMHPDEVTMDIVLTAKKYKKAFAVVPCCVFPSKFPNRLLSDGKFVLEYNDLVKYIHETVEGSHVEFLKIEGKNKVIYKKIY